MYRVICHEPANFVRTFLQIFIVHVLGIQKIHENCESIQAHIQFLKSLISNNLINKRHGSQMLIKTASRPNQTSYRKFDPNEFVQNSLCCNMGMIIFDL